MANYDVPSYRGAMGYLATITTAQEQFFLQSLFANASTTGALWLGGGWTTLLTDTSIVSSGNVPDLYWLTGNISIFIVA